MKLKQAKRLKKILEIGVPLLCAALILFLFAYQPEDFGWYVFGLVCLAFIFIYFPDEIHRGYVAKYKAEREFDPLQTPHRKHARR